MKFSDNSMSAVLLCSYIGINNDDAYKPLTLKEWNELLDSVIEHGQQPSVVMDPSQSFLRETDCSQAYIERIKRLMSRAGTVAFQLDELEGKGIDIVTQFDADYPVLMKRRLKKKTPPVLFYSGDIGLAKKIGIGVAGSRNVDAEGVEFARKLVEKAAAERLVVYSGGAKGVDSIAEKAAVESGSAAISFVADSLLSKIRKKEILDAVVNRKCLLLSDVRPDVGFSAARAMNRNKYIYASSYGTFVVASDYNKGGTWAGAAEAMKNEWTKVLYHCAVCDGAYWGRDDEGRGGGSVSCGKRADGCLVETVMSGLPPEVRERALREEIVRYSFEGLYRRARRRLSKSGISDSMRASFAASPLQQRN